MMSIGFESFGLEMGADSNMSFHYGAVQPPAFNHRAILFQSGAINTFSSGTSNTSSMIPTGNSGGALYLDTSNTGSMIQAGNSGCAQSGNSGGALYLDTSNTGSMIQAGNSGGALYLDPVPGLKHDTGLAVDWSVEEQSLLDEGLAKFADEPSIMKYIKIAATLAGKNVRDVALRCRWMTENLQEESSKVVGFRNIPPNSSAIDLSQRKESGKRRKPEDHYIGKKMKDKKEKLADSSSKANIPLAMQPNTSAYSHMMHHMDHNDRISCEVPAVGGTTRLLLEENVQFFSQITSNLSMLKVQDNIDLFYRTMNNITTILNDMRETPGIMNQMPPLPVSIDEELVNTILHSTAQAMMFGPPVGGIHLKQDPGC